MLLFQNAQTFNLEGSLVRIFRIQSTIAELTKHRCQYSANQLRVSPSCERSSSLDSVVRMLCSKLWTWF